MFGFLVGSQCRVAGEHFNPGGGTYEPLLSSSTEACPLCACPRSEAEIGAVPSGHLVSLLSTCKGLRHEGRRQTHPCDSSQAGGEGVPAAGKPGPDQVGFEVGLLPDYPMQC